MSDRMHFAPSQTAKPQQAKSKENPAALFGAEYSRDIHAGMSQDEHLARYRSVSEGIRSADKARAAEIWRQQGSYLSNPEKSLVQRQLKVGVESDPLEQEADEVADRVMRAPSGTLDSLPRIMSAQNSMQRYTMPAIQRKESEDMQSSAAGIEAVTDTMLRELQGLGYDSFEALESDFKENIAQWATVSEEQDYLELLEEKGFVTQSLSQWSVNNRIEVEEANLMEQMAQSARVAIARHEGPREKVAEIKDEDGSLIGYNTTDWAYDLTGKPIYKIASDAMTDAGLLDPIELAADIMTGGARRLGKEAFEAVTKAATRRGIGAALSEGAKQIIYTSLKGSARVLRAQGRGKARSKIKQEIEKSRSRKGAAGQRERRKPVNLPAYKSIPIDMAHIKRGHIKSKHKNTKKDQFPEMMSEKQIEKSIREAYQKGKRIYTQQDRVVVHGSSGGMKIEMWVNTKLKMIETAYPIGFR